MATMSITCQNSIGMRQFHLFNWLTSVRNTKEAENHFDQDSANRETNSEEKSPDLANR